MKTLVWRSRTGKALETVGRPQLGLREFALSPDRRWVATTVGEPSDIWIQDLARSTATRLTFDALGEFLPSWSPSGRELVYTLQVAGGVNRLMRKAVDGTGEPAALVETSYASTNADWSRDGRYLVFHGPSGEGTASDILYAELERNSGVLKPLTFLSTPANEGVPKLSPDGRFLAYVSDESGQREVYVRPFPDGDGRWQASVNGGTQPRWRDDGTELYYVDGGYALMAVPVATGQVLMLGQPQRLFESADLIFRNQPWPQYDVSADGQRFLTSMSVQDENASSVSIHVVLNWYEEFRNREQE
jgi:Tol biopolymer transport system component